MLTFKEAKNYFHKFVTPHGPNEPIVSESIRFASQKLQDELQGKQAFLTLEVPVQRYQFALPQGIQSLLKVQFKNHPFIIQNLWYRFSENYKFQIPSNHGQAMYLGRFPTFYSPDPAASYELISENAFDPGESVEIDGIQISSSPYSLPAATPFARVTKTITPVAGTITIRNSVTLEILAQYKPNETAPDYQRYSTPTYKQIQSVLALVTRSSSFLLSDDDFIFPDNMNALRYGVQAYLYDQNNDLERAMFYWNEASKCLYREDVKENLGQQSTVVFQVPALMNFNTDV